MSAWVALDFDRQVTDHGDYALLDPLVSALPSCRLITAATSQVSGATAYLHVAGHETARPSGIKSLNSSRTDWTTAGVS